MPTYADVAPEVMEAFGTWFRDLRRRKQRSERGHNNPVVFLREAAGSSAITEVVEPFSHLVRLEDMRRAAVVQAEHQWRSTMSRHGSLPRGPAILAARLFNQLTARGVSANSVVASEAAQRQHLVAARDGWMREVTLRSEYELECLQEYALSQLASRSASSTDSLLAEEATARDGISQVSQVLLVNIHQQAEANIARLCFLVHQHASFHRVEDHVGQLIANESIGRHHLLAAAERHIQSIGVAHRHQLEKLSVVVRERFTQNQNALRGVLSTIHLVEDRARQSLVEAEASHFRDIVVRSRQALENMQRILMQKNSVYNGQVERLQNRVERELFRGEAELRIQLVDAYIRWVTQVSSQGLLGVVLRHDRASKQYLVEAKKDAKDFNRLVHSEELERAGIEKSRADWVSRHLRSLEALERAEIPKKLARQALIDLECNTRSAPGKPLLASSSIRAQLELEKTELKVRNQIMLSEKSWRLEGSLRMKQMIGDDKDIEVKLREVIEKELVNRNAIAGSEVGWRTHLRQATITTIARMQDKSRSVMLSAGKSVVKSKKS